MTSARAAASRAMVSSSRWCTTVTRRLTIVWKCRSGGTAAARTTGVGTRRSSAARPAPRRRKGTRIREASVTWRDDDALPRPSRHRRPRPLRPRRGRALSLLRPRLPLRVHRHVAHGRRALQRAPPDRTPLPVVRAPGPRDGGARPDPRLPGTSLRAGLQALPLRRRVGLRRGPLLSAGRVAGRALDLAAHGLPPFPGARDEAQPRPARGTGALYPAGTGRPEGGGRGGRPESTP